MKSIECALYKQGKCDRGFIEELNKLLAEAEKPKAERWVIAVRTRGRDTISFITKYSTEKRYIHSTASGTSGEVRTYKSTRAAFAAKVELEQQGWQNDEFFVVRIS